MIENLFTRKTAIWAVSAIFASLLIAFIVICINPAQYVRIEKDSTTVVNYYRPIEQGDQL